jgi:hypothetical protein
MSGGGVDESIQSEHSPIVERVVSGSLLSTNMMSVASSAVVESGVMKVAGIITSDAQKKMNKQRIRNARRSREQKKYEANQLYAPAVAWLCCPIPGCNRQFSLYGRMQQHLHANNCSFSGSEVSAPSKPSLLHPCDGMTIKEMAVRFMDEQYRNPTVEVGGLRDSDDGRALVAQSLHAQAVAAAVDTNKESSCRFGWAKRETLTHPKNTADQLAMIRWAWQYGEKDGNSKISPTEVVRLMRVTGLASSVEGAKYSMEEFWRNAHIRSRGMRLFDDYSTGGVMEEWRVGLVYQSISTEKRCVERAHAGKRPLTATEYRRELVYMLSADTMIAEDGSPILNPTSKEPTLNPFATWEHSLGADAIAAALLDKHDVKTNFARIKQKDIKGDTATFGESRVYWAFVINAISRVGTGLVPVSASISSASSGATSAAEDRRTGGPEEEIEEEDEADEEAQLQLLNYNPGRDREMLEDSLDDMGAYDDNGENEFMA